MGTQPRSGMDHTHYPWSPLPGRKMLTWPYRARVALCINITLEHMEWSPPLDSFTVNLAGGSFPRPFPDYARLSNREYGHRVGIFRILDVLEKHSIKPMMAMDALTAQNYPYLVRHCVSRGCEFVAHGISVSRMISSKMPESEERAYIKTSLDALKAAAGTTPIGWFGPEYGESSRTPKLLTESGIRYVCDWANDEQPYPMEHGQLLALPIMLDLDDINALFDRRIKVARYAQMIKECFDIMYQDSLVNARVLVLNLHPWLIGQPFRIKFLDEALSYIIRHQGVWATTGAEIADWYKSNPPR